MSEVIVVEGRGGKNMENVGDKQASTSGGNIEMQVLSSNESFVNRMRNHLREFSEGEIKSRDCRSSVCIFRVPQSFREINCKDAIDPEMVSIGPYHRGKEEFLAFENYKWQFLSSLLSQEKVRDVEDLLYAMKQLEKEARSYYSEPSPMSSDDFCGMMVLDGCFIVELFQQVHDDPSLNNSSSPLFMKKWLIPILLTDILKLENQLPLFVLQKIYDISLGNRHLDPHKSLFSDQNSSICFLALNFFCFAYPVSPSSLEKTLERARRSLERSCPVSTSSLEASPSSLEGAPIFGGHHLLHLFHHCCSPSTLHQSQNYHLLPNQSMPCVTLLRSAGVKFRPPKRTIDNFLEIKFDQGVGVLEIPPITINDFTSTALINCAALEQCLRRIIPKHFSTYIAFMSRLINSGGDVTFLCDDGIISNYSHNDLHVSLFFKQLGAIASHNIGDHPYLSEQFRGVDAYYRSHWATLRRRYFSNPWTSISVVTASVLLVLTAISAIMSVLSYTVHHS